MNNPKMVYIHEDTGIEAQWSGGAYIDLGYIDDDGEFHASDCINVYDYAKSETDIPFTTSAMKEGVDEYLAPECDECEYKLDKWDLCVNEECSEYEKP